MWNAWIIGEQLLGKARCLRLGKERLRTKIVLLSTSWFELYISFFFLPGMFGEDDSI